MKLTDTIFIGVILLLSFFWSLFLLSEWGSDYGMYYVSALFLSDDYQLYKEVFDHKGPVYYLFLKGLGSVLGWGASQAFISLGVTVAFYLLTIFYVAKYYIRNTWVIAIIIGLAFATLFQQPSNASITLFQSAVLLLFFHALFKLINKISVIYLALSVIILCIAILTRIDSAIYLLLCFPVGFHLSKRLVKIQKIILGLGLGILVSFVICRMIFTFMNFSLNDFYIHNVDYNKWFRTGGIIPMLYRPEHLKQLMVSGLLPITLIILNNMFLQTERAQNTSVIKYVMAPERLLTLSILFFSILGWIFSGSDKNYHVFMLIPGMFFFIICNLNLIEKSISKLFPAFMVYLIIICAFTLEPSALTFINKKENLFNPFDKYSDVTRYEKTIDDMRGRSLVYIVGGRGWPYLFSGVKPATAINNWWLYILPEPFITTHTLEDHNTLINRSSGYEFWINNLLLNKENTSPLLREILDASAPVKSDGYYTKFVIQK